MGKNKLRKWAEMEDYAHVIQPRFEDVFKKDHELKGKWRENFFASDNPIILELGCGKGEYTTAMAGKYPDKNFLGIDIKGARIWKGAKTAGRLALGNVGFLRTRIELIESFFAKEEVDEIWITFPDPQLKKRRNKKRLTGARFINHYRSFLKRDGLIHLKTDSRELYDYTLELIRENGIQLISNTGNLYAQKNIDDVLSIRTHYEQIFLDAGKDITYICFRPDIDKPVKELKPDDEREPIL